MTSTRKKPSGKARRSNNRTVRFVLILLLIIGMAVVGLGSYLLTREWVFTQAIADIPTPRPAFVLAENVPPSPTEELDEGEPTPTVALLDEMPQIQDTAAAEATLTPWDGKDRVTVLVMGIDYRDWTAEEGYARSDTMMLVTMDPVAKTAGMLSIPRDLWVAIPGFSHGKINTAHALGDAYKLPGGGPALAVKTVEHVIGVPVHYYAVVDFGAFMRFIDEMGGLKLDIPYKIKVDPFDGDPRYLQPGVQTLPGDLVLAYARNRTTGDGDFDRARRQQQVLLGIRNRILDFDLLPTLIENSPALYREIVSGLRTNLQLDEVIKLAVLAQQVPNENIRQGVIDINYVGYGWSPDELSILIPYPDRIRVLRDEIFATAGSVSPLTPGNQLERMALEGARISVQNGSNNSDLARRTANYLTARGAIVVEVIEAGQRDTKTKIIDHSGRPFAVQYLVSMLGIETRQISFEYDPSAAADIEVILGEEWAANNNLP
jgi:polyisoprenyl-teichoic acid--peptidoglycan teichoic acid transferase